MSDLSPPPSVASMTATHTTSKGGSQHVRTRILSPSIEEDFAKLCNDVLEKPLKSRRLPASFFTFPNPPKTAATQPLAVATKTAKTATPATSGSLATKQRKIKKSVPLQNKVFMPISHASRSPVRTQSQTPSPVTAGTKTGAKKSQSKRKPRSKRKLIMSSSILSPPSVTKAVVPTNNNMAGRLSAPPVGKPRSTGDASRSQSLPNLEVLWEHTDLSGMDLMGDLGLDIPLIDTFMDVDSFGLVDSVDSRLSEDGLDGYQTPPPSSSPQAPLLGNNTMLHANAEPTVFTYNLDDGLDLNLADPFVSEVLESRDG